jgi:hypothetical protein
MKKSFFCLLMLPATLSCFGQGIRSGDMEFVVSGGPHDPYVIIGIHTFTEDIRFNVVVDWGDGTIETIYGAVFSEPEPNLYSNEYLGEHIYQDTGIYEITYRDSFWVDGIVNVSNSAMQPFILKSRVWLTSDPSFGYNHSVWLSTTSGFIQQDESGVIVHPPVPVDWDGDDIIENLIPLPVTGYFLPQATDSLKCCFIWDKPVETGQYAFGMEFEDWREGKWRGTVQRFILVDVDSIPVTPSKEQLPLVKGLVISPNPAYSTIHITVQLPAAYAGTVSLSAYNLLGQPLWQRTLPAAGGELQASVDVSTWPPGVYFISLEASGVVWVEKVLVR